MSLPWHLGVEAAAAHRRDLEAVPVRHRHAPRAAKRFGATLVHVRSVRHRRRALRTA